MKFRKLFKKSETTQAPTVSRELEAVVDAAGGQKGDAVLLSKLMPYIILGVTYAILLVLLLPLPKQSQLEVGKPSPIKVVATKSFKVVDQASTDKLRTAAASKVLPVFKKNFLAHQEAMNQINSIFSAAQSIGEQPELESSERITQLAEATGFSTEKDLDTLELLLKYANYSLLRDTLGENLRELFDNGVVPDEKSLSIVRQHILEGIDVLMEDGTIGRKFEVASIQSIVGANNRLEKKLASQFNKPIEDAEPRMLAMRLGKVFLNANLLPDEKQYQSRKERESRKIVPIEIVIQKNQKILDEGEVIPEKITLTSQDGHLIEVDAMLVIHQLSKHLGSVSWSQVVARCFLIFVPLIFIGLFQKRFHRNVWHDSAQFTCLMAQFILVLAMGQLLHFLSSNPALETLGYAMPVALAGFLITVLMNHQQGFFAVLILSIYSGLLFGDYQHSVIGLSSGLISVFLAGGVSRRIDISWVGIKVSLVTCLVATLIYLTDIESPKLILEDQDIWSTWCLMMVWSGMSGVLTIMMAGMLMAPLEKMMGVITDLQLLELSQKNQLLRDLEEQAPGSYQHSLNVATLAESAADSIGANGLLVRVSAIYHDIGKMGKPQYFSENQIRETDRKTHDKLAPSMSRLLIINHVKDGLEMAEENNLPQFICDAIAQHHGTTLLTYFYDKALRKDSKDVVKESDYRYPGPKPQSMEMAILMLADSLEAASRSLPPGLHQGELYQFVRKIIHEKFTDDQFDECDLTLSDLSKLANAFSRSLVSLLHRRIPYPTLQAKNADLGEQSDQNLLMERRKVEKQKSVIGAGTQG